MRKKLLSCLAIALVILFTSLVSCIPISNTTPPATGISSSPGAIDPAWKLSAPPGSGAFLQSIADVVDVAEHAVVAIHTETVTIDAFNNPITQKGAGSGWILDSNGLIVTNNHVVDGAQTVTVHLNDNRIFTAEVIRTDSLTDLAVIKINASGLTLLRVGDGAKLRVGDWVVAIGNPLGLGISAKEGIISRKGVTISVEGQTLYNVLETSAAINPGNSGGPLVSMAGEVIGITSAKIADVGVEGMGYAINIHDAIPIIESLVKVGCVTRAWLGTETVTVDPGMAILYKLSVSSGALVSAVVPGSPAEKAGIQEGDVIVGFGNSQISNSPDLTRLEVTSQIGQKVTIILLRGNSRKTVDVLLVESPLCKF